MVPASLFFLFDTTRKILCSINYLTSQALNPNREKVVLGTHTLTRTVSIAFRHRQDLSIPTPLHPRLHYPCLKHPMASVCLFFLLSTEDGWKRCWFCFFGLLTSLSATKLFPGLVAILMSHNFMRCRTETESGDHDFYLCSSHTDTDPNIREHGLNP